MNERHPSQHWRRLGALGTSVVLAGALALYTRRQMVRRGYPSWDACRCRFKLDEGFFQVWHSWSEQRGETLVEHEFGINITHPPQWLRRALHYSAQLCAICNPLQRYVERVDLPGVAAPHAPAEPAWQKEITGWPRGAIGTVTAEMRPIAGASAAASPSPSGATVRAFLDPRSRQYVLKNCCSLQAPAGTRVDFIGWTPAQISYCTARLHPQNRIALRWKALRPRG
jgi:hypothetical protein